MGRGRMRWRSDGVRGRGRWRSDGKREGEMEE